MNEEKKNVKKEKEVNYGVKDIAMIENPQTYSTFGKMVDSNKRTAPSFGFGTSTRKTREKVFTSKKLSKTQFLGKKGPGPIYNPVYVPKKNDPAYSFGNDVRGRDYQAKYDHYRIVDKYSDVVKADLYRKPSEPSYKFRAGRRFGSQKPSETPGPIYEHNGLLKENYPQFSFGYAKPQEHDSVLTRTTATPANVGPGKYEDNYKVLSHVKNNSKVSFTKSARLSLCGPRNYRNETYETYSSINKQSRTKMINSNGGTFGKSKKSIGMGISKRDMATQPVRLKLAHAHY